MLKASLYNVPLELRPKW